MKKRLAALAMAMVLATGMLAGCSSKLDDSEIVVKMGDIEITADIANFYTRYQQAFYETYYGVAAETWDMEVESGKTYASSSKEGILKDLQTMFVLDAHKDEYDIEISKDEQDKIEEAAAAFVESNSKEDLAVVSGNESTVERVLELMTIQTKMQDAMVADVDTEVSDEEAAQKKMEYVSFPFTTTDEEGNSVELTEEELASLKKDAEEFSKQVESQEDFNAFAAEQEYNPLEATFDAESTVPAAEVVEAAEALKEGEHTGLIETETAYYVAKLVSLMDRDATDAKKDSIVQERKDTQYQELVDKWIEDLDPSVDEKVWKKIDFKSQGVTIKDTSTEEDAAGEDNAVSEDPEPEEDAGAEPADESADDNSEE